jgi:hypothetical protein
VRIALMKRMDRLVRQRPARRSSPDRKVLRRRDSRRRWAKRPRTTAVSSSRQESVLLKPGQWQMDVGVNYTIFDHHFTQIQLPDIIPVDFRDRQRLLVTPLALRYSLTDRLQAFVNVPFGWTNTEISTLGADDFSNTGGIGDTNAGVSWWVHKGCGHSYDPDVIATFGFTAPSGKGNFLAAILGTPQTTLGQGLWAASWNVLFIHTYDPVIVFYGFGSRYPFAREFGGVEVAPGGQYNYQCGVGFAVNERITLSTALIGAYFCKPRVDDQRLAGLIQEPIYLRIACTAASRCQRICEPFVQIGLTPDAANASFGVTWTF